MVEESRNTNIGVGAANTRISEEVALPRIRKAIVLTNVSTGGQVITLAFGAEAVAGYGIVLYPTGQYSESMDSAFIPTQQEINAISSAVGGLLAVHERVI